MLIVLEVDDGYMGFHYKHAETHTCTHTALIDASEWSTKRPKKKTDQKVSKISLEMQMEWTKKMGGEIFAIFNFRILKRQEYFKCLVE